MFYPKIIDLTSGKSNRFKSVTTKIICVGRNYAAHAEELKNLIPKEPLLFIKSTNTLVDLADPIEIPTDQGECHHELELAILIGDTLSKAKEQQISEGIAGIGLALDLTLRDLQQQLKDNKHPWEKAKSFDGACPVSDFVQTKHFAELPNELPGKLGQLHFLMKKNGHIVQQGNSKNMLFNIVMLIQEISRHFTLYPGDIILTGTPAGVASLNSGDQLQFELQGKYLTSTHVV
jgi:2-keto-4-pentenoate hydratase/2-oxohepta-3-ene-1,7-dioic acid hydratase in catechol pathway